jgi:N-methylhydantoinase B
MDEAPPRRCDSVTLEIVRGAIRAAQAEMEALIERTAMSAFIREKKDFYTAVFDADGVMAVGSNVPIFGDIAGPVFQRFPAAAMLEGDLYWYSDCYASRGAVSHSNDQVFLAPVFLAGRRVAFVMGWAHFADIGGLRPGSISPDTTDIFQEGIIIPPTRLVAAGVTNDAALEIFYRNSRYPSLAQGDARALMASVALGVVRMREVAARFGAEILADALAQLLARTEATVRQRLKETFPVGTWKFTDRIDSDGHGNGPFRLRFALTRTPDDRFIFDATESDDQSPGPVNFLMNRDVPGMALGLSFLGGDPTQVANAGCSRAINEVRLREGSILQPRFPAPLGMRGLTMMRVLAGLNGLVSVAGGQAPAAHAAYVHHPAARHDEQEALPDERRHRRRLWCARLRRWHRRRVFRGAGELSGRVPGTGISGAAPPLRAEPRQRRPRPLARRLRHRAGIRDHGRGSRAGRAHRWRGKPALGRFRRPVRWRRARRGESRPADGTGAAPAFRRQPPGEGRDPAHRDRRRRRARPPA